MTFLRNFSSPINEKNSKLDSVCFNKKKMVNYMVAVDNSAFSKAAFYTAVYMMKPEVKSNYSFALILYRTTFI
jgi:hypothetical protein